MMSSHACQLFFLDESDWFGLVVIASTVGYDRSILLLPFAFPIRTHSYRYQTQTRSVMTTLRMWFFHSLFVRWFIVYMPDQVVCNVFLAIKSNMMFQLMWMHHVVYFALVLIIKQILLFLLTTLPMLILAPFLSMPHQIFVYVACKYLKWNQLE